MEQNDYTQLQSLNESDYQIIAGETHIIGWEVKSESDTYLGKVDDLLFEKTSNAVRYLVVDLENNGMNLGDKKVIIPIGIANLHISNDEVILPNVHVEQFNALPPYEENKVSQATEIQVREIIGSPAALRIEETIAEFDQKKFYNHHHFDKNSFNQRGIADENLSKKEISEDPIAYRAEEANTIHELIDNSKNSGLHAAELATGVNTHHNEHQKITAWKKDNSEDHNEESGSSLNQPKI